MDRIELALEVLREHTSRRVRLARQDERHRGDLVVGGRTVKAYLARPRAPRRGLTVWTCDTTRARDADVLLLLCASEHGDLERVLYVPHDEIPEWCLTVSRERPRLAHRRHEGREGLAEALRVSRQAAG